MKLLMAFIEASGFDVERTVDITCGKIIKAGFWGCSEATNNEFEFFPATNDMPEAEYREVIRTTDYKVTKKKITRDGDLFSLGYQVAYDAIRGKLQLLDYDIDENEMDGIMDEIIFHIARVSPT